jgi:hypothetical protein
VLEPLVLPVAPVVPEFGLLEGVVLDVELDEPGDVLLDVLGELELPLMEPEPVPVAPMDDVVPVLPLAVVSVLVLPLVLGDALPLRLPEPLEVDGVVLPVVVLLELEPVPLEPVVALSLRWQALSDRAAAMAIAMAVYWVFIRTP